MNMIKKIVIIMGIFASLGGYCHLINAHNTIPLYFCTASDDTYFECLLNLIGSLHHTNFEQLAELAVFDLGLTEKQRTQLQKIEKVQIYHVEPVNPHIITKLPYCKGYAKMVPGIYSWKPVIVKQALDMFPYVLYIDAGTTILKPLTDIFAHIIENGYFFVDCGVPVRWMTNRYLIEKFNLVSEENKWILDASTAGVSAHLLGVSPAVYNNFVFPCYELAKDIKNFEDDGTTPNGYGTGRHDQTLASIIIRLAKLDIYIQDHTGNTPPLYLTIDGEKKPIHTTWNKNVVNANTVLFHSRDYMPKLVFYKSCIRYKK